MISLNVLLSDDQTLILAAETYCEHKEWTTKLQDTIDTVEEPVSSPETIGIRVLEKTGSASKEVNRIDFSSSTLIEVFSLPFPSNFHQQNQIEEPVTKVLDICNTTYESVTVSFSTKFSIEDEEDGHTVIFQPEERLTFSSFQRLQFN